MNRFFFLILATAMIFSCSEDVDQGQNNKRLVWSDEFYSNGPLNDEKWAYDLGDGCPTLCGWGNNELQRYTRDLSNVRVEDGNLVIEALYNPEDRSYTSARIKTTNLGNWKYGTVEVRAKLPSEEGLWSAVWMLPENWSYGNWPASGEVDLVEHEGSTDNLIYGAVHTASFNGMAGTQKVDSFKVENLSTEFHTYSVDWTADKLDFFVDGTKYKTYKKPSENSRDWPFDNAFHLIINLAVRHNDNVDPSASFNFTSQKMLVDYVRVYQKTD